MDVFCGRKQTFRKKKICEWDCENSWRESLKKWNRTRGRDREGWYNDGIRELVWQKEIEIERERNWERVKLKEVVKKHMDKEWVKDGSQKWRKWLLEIG